MDASRIEFVRLTSVPLDGLVKLLNEPRNVRHMPLSQAFTAKSAAQWAEAKDEQWSLHGYGPWGILLDSAFAGWCGFQREDSGADFALVLLPEYWGSGISIVEKAFSIGFEELSFDEVVIALPLTRNPGRALARIGFTTDGEVVHSGVKFRQYRLKRTDWMHCEHDR